MTPITSKWLNQEKTIALVQYPVEWNWDEFHLGSRATGNLLQEVPHPVVLIIETHHIRVPAGGALSHAIHELKSFPPNLAALVVVISSPFIRSMTNFVIGTAQHLLWYPIQITETRAQARLQAADYLQALDHKKVTD
jgi:hypothetical protein